MAPDVAAPVAELLGVGVGVVAVGVGVGGLGVAGPVGAVELLVADAEGDVLVDGAECVGVGDCRPLDVGRAEPVAVGAFDADSRLVPVPPPSAAVAGTEAVVGGAARLADCDGDVGFPVFPAEVAAGVTLLVSRTAIIAMIPQAARLAPAISRPRRLGREPPCRSGSSL